ncbi:MAG: D-amino-acid transaminase [Pseudomonadota bacterium]
MSRIAYVNGKYIPHTHASVHVEDRGYQFADAIYEACEVKDGHIIDMPRHLTRLDRSLSELQINWDFDRKAFSGVLCETVRRNRVWDGIVYMQISRGVAKRDHVFPEAGTPCTVVVTSRSVDPAIGAHKAAHGVAAITVPENRWERVDIKSVGLLPNALARQKAKEQGAAEAIFVDNDGIMKEGGATNVWIVTKDGTLQTRPADFGILKGITRAVAIETANAMGLKIREKGFTKDEALEARECFITAATTLVMPVVQLDGKPIANGHPGEVSRALRGAFHKHAHRTAVYA